MGKVFGNADPSATIALPEGVAGPQQLDPKQGLSDSQLMTRGIASGAGQGLAGWLQSQSQPQPQHQPFQWQPIQAESTIDPNLLYGNTDYLTQAKQRFGGR